MRYAVINNKDEVVNVIVWNGEDPYSPKQDCRLEKVREDEKSLAYVGAKWYGAMRFSDPVIIKEEESGLASD